MRGTTTPTEWSTLQGDFLHWFRSLIEAEDCPFGEFTTDEILRSGKRPDGLLKARDAKCFCEFELKQPHVPATSYDLVKDAADKAQEVGAPYFVTCNVRELILWTRHDFKPILEWDRQPFGTLRITSLQEYPLFKERLRQEVQQLFRTLCDLHSERVEPAQVFPAVPIDERLIHIVQDHVDAFAFAFALQIKDQCQQRAFRNRLHSWFLDQGLPSARDDGFFLQAARILSYLLINKVIFYEVARSAHPELAPLEIPEDLRGDRARRRLQQLFGSVLKIDYESIFQTDVLDEILYPAEVVPRLRAFLHQLREFNLSRLPHDIVGRVYERIIPTEERQLYGQFFTRSDVVDLILAFCVKSKDASVLDPSCGSGTFLVRAHSRLRYLDRPVSHSHYDLLLRLWGFDIAPFPAHLATANLIAQDIRAPLNYPHVFRKDFFDVQPELTCFTLPWVKRAKQGALARQVAAQRVDAVCGNPPYTRERDVQRMTAATEPYKEQLAQVVRQDFPGAKLSKQAGIHAYFFLHGFAFLKDGGRLGLVTLDSWLDTEYGRDLQRFFLENGNIIAIISSAVERWFPDALVNTAITILERSEPNPNHLVKFVTLKKRLEDVLPPNSDRDRWPEVDRLVQLIEETPCKNSQLIAHEDNNLRILTRSQADLRQDGLEDGKYIGSKWGRWLRSPDVYFKILRRAGDKLAPLSAVAQVRRGFTSGANDFFYITHQHAAARKVEPRFLKPLVRSPRQCLRPVIDPSDLKYRAFLCHLEKPSLKGAAALKWIREAEARPDNPPHLRPTCKSRQRWYDLGRREPWPILWPMIHSERHIVCLNPALQVDHNLFEIKPNDPPSQTLLFASLLSTFSWLEKELVARAYGGGSGPSKTEGVDIRRLLVLDPSKLSPADRAAIEHALLPLLQRDFLPVSRELEQEDRLLLDNAVLRALGFHDDSEREQILSEVYDAVESLVRGRTQKATSVQSKASSTAKSKIEKVAEDILLHDFPLEEQRSFPSDFLPDGTATRTITLPEGEARVGTDLFEAGNLAVLLVGDDRIECRSPDEAAYLLCAHQLGLRQVPLPDDPSRVPQALQAYRAYVRQMLPGIRQAAQSSSVGKAQSALYQSLLRHLGILPED